VLSRYTVLPWEDADEYQALVAALVAEHAKAIERRNPVLVAFDPFVKTHSLSENDNAAKHRTILRA
jgi:hypothetical protein